MCTSNHHINFILPIQRVTSLNEVTCTHWSTVLIWCLQASSVTSFPHPHKRVALFWPKLSYCSSNAFTVTKHNGFRKYIFSTFGKRPRIISCSKLHGNCSKLPETGSNYLPLMPPLWLAQFPNYHSSFSIKALLGKSLLPSSLATWCFLVATPKPFCKQPVTPLHQTSLIQHDKETTHLKQKTIKLWRNLLEGLNSKAYYLEKYTWGKKAAYKNFLYLCDHLTRKTTSRWR